MSYRPEQTRRKKSFKQGINLDDARRKREENIIEMRRQKKDENIQKKRMVQGNDVDAEGETMDQAAPAPLNFTNKQYDNLVQELSSSDPEKQLEAVVAFRKLLSIEKSPPINDIINLGIVGTFVQLLQRQESQQLQFESAWALTNIASGTSENTRVVVENGAVPVFVQTLQSPSEDVREQVVWALGNIAGDSSECRDYVLQNQAIQPVLDQLQANSKISMIRNAAWTISNMCRGKPPPDFAMVSVCIPYLARCLDIEDEEVLVDSCWALSYLSDGEDQKIQQVVSSGVVPKLVNLLMQVKLNGNNQVSIIIPALRVVGNIVTGDDQVTQAVIDCGGLQCLLHLVSKDFKKSIKKEACWAISNITAGTREQVQAVIESNLIAPLLYLLEHADFEIKKEVAWAVCNATSSSEIAHIKYLVSQGCLKPLCNLLGCADNKIIVIVIEGLENILKVGEQLKQGNDNQNPYTLLIEEADGLDKLEALENHPSQEVYNKAVSLMHKFFEMEDADEQAVDLGADIDPSSSNVASSGQFNFGRPMNQ